MIASFSVAGCFATTLNQLVTSPVPMVMNETPQTVQETPPLRSNGAGVSDGRLVGSSCENLATMELQT
jgi:hypothetical protein